MSNSPAPSPPETGTPADPVETAVAKAPAKAPKTAPSVFSAPANVDELAQLLQDGPFSSLFIAVCASVAGNLVPRGCKARAGADADEIDYIRWAVRTSVEVAAAVERDAREFWTHVDDTGAPPTWATAVSQRPL